MTSELVVFHLVRNSNSGNANQDLDKVLAYFGTYDNLSIQHNSEGVTINYPDTYLTATLKKVDDQVNIVCHQKDNLTIHLFRNFAASSGYRIYNAKTKSFTVNDPNLIDLTTVQISPELITIFKRHHLIPLFNYRNSQVYFAKDSQGQIHLINRYLLEFLLSQKELPIQSDFSTKVAANIGQFIAFFDRGLIPISFYTAYFNPSKIFNSSGFDLQKIEADVLVTPVFFEFDQKRQCFNQIDSAELTRKDLVARGKSLEQYIKGLSKTFLAAKVPNQIDFELNGKKSVVPRLTISIFLNKNS